MIYSFEGKKPATGNNTYVSETAMIIGDVDIGEDCYIGHGAILRGDYGRINIGSGSSIEEGVIIHAPPDETCEIGEKVTAGHGAIIHSQKIGKYAVVGMGAIMGMFSQISEWTIVAEGGIVRMKQIVPDNLVVGGTPAHTIRETSAEDKEAWITVKMNYAKLAEKYLKNAMQLIT
jgi:carbonic anhydrase/acetyltransferase-like protein (isoleucine patch superfamily)